MTEQEARQILDSENGYIIAPAGHGKTEMITDIVKYAPRRILVITHTNAGVDALRKRFNRKKIEAKKFSLTTIAGLCTKWCDFFPQTAGIDQALSPINREEARMYYDQLYSGTERIFLTDWAGVVLKSSYCGVIVDEYQDCTKTQHDIMCAINKYIPVWVLGDPMQGIFGWAGELVDWNSIGFKCINVSSCPWRWQKTCPQLGIFLGEVRDRLLPSLNGVNVTLSIDDTSFIEIIPANNYNPYKFIGQWNQFDSVLFISKMEHQQLQLCKITKGFFQQDEKKDNELLYSLAEKADTETGIPLLLSFIKFFKKCASNVDTEIKSYILRLEKGSLDFSRIKKNPEFGQLIIDAVHSCSARNVSAIYNWLASSKSINVYRRELVTEAIRCLNYSEANECTVNTAVYKIRSDSNLQNRYPGFKYLSSRTVLSKGLEFECVVIDMRDPLPVKDFYVALTRATKKIYIISDSKKFDFTSMNT